MTVEAGVVGGGGILWLCEELCVIHGSVKSPTQLLFTAELCGDPEIYSYVSRTWLVRAVASHAFFCSSLVPLSLDSEGERVFTMHFTF